MHKRLTYDNIVLSENKGFFDGLFLNDFINFIVFGRNEYVKAIWQIAQVWALLNDIFYAQQNGFK